MGGLRFFLFFFFLRSDCGRGNDQRPRALGQGDARDAFFFSMSLSICILGFFQNFASKKKLNPNLLDLRFADDILIFARSRHELGHLISSLMIHFGQVGLLLNAEKNCGVN